MAGAVPRLGMTLWTAWVGVAAIAAAIEVWISFHLFQLFGGGLTGSWREVVLYVPAILGQYLVLRAVAHIPHAVLALWVGLSLVAAAIVPEMEFPWLAAVFRPVIDWIFANFPLTTALTIEGYVLGLRHFVFPLLFGLAEGVALAWLLHRYWVAGVWVGVSFLAAAVASPLAGTWLVYRFNGFPTDQDRILLVLVPNLVFFVTYSAVTGAGLVVVLRRWWVRALGPAAR